MGIIKNKLNEKISENNLKTYYNTTGKIIDFDIQTNIAKVEYYGPLREKKIIMNSVPISSNLGGFTSHSIIPGMTCNLSFYGNNLNSPVITGITDNFYREKISSDQGAYLINSKILNIKKPEKLSPMIKDWIDENNTKKNKYENDFKNYKEYDIIKETINIINPINKFKKSEEGITNINTKSTIKIKENGDIDIFVSNNTGIRIDNDKKQIQIFGDVIINGTLNKIS